MQYTIREATAEDGDDLLELWHGFTAHLSKYDERYTHKESADERWLSYFENQLVDSKYGVVFIAEETETQELLGILEARVMGNHPIFRLQHHGYINGHYVREEHRGQGIGKDLIEAASDWFASEPRDVDFFRVDVLEGDEKSATLYQEYGLQPVEHIYEKKIE